MRPPSPPIFSSILLLLLLLPFFGYTVTGGSIGVDYGRDANNLMPPQKVVELLRANGITRVRIYDADATVLRALANTGIQVVISLRNDLLRDAARRDFADGWVRDNVAAYRPATQITAVDVGNEVSTQRSDLNSVLVPAMQNVYDALAARGLAGDVKVSSPISFGVVGVSFPPSAGAFRGDMVDPMRQLLGFLQRTGNTLSVNLFPFMALRYNPEISLDYVHFRPYKGVVDDRTKLVYYNLFDAQLDAVFSAASTLGFGGAAAAGTSLQRDRRRGRVTETGESSAGGVPGGRRNTTALWESKAEVTTPDNAAAYNGNLVQKVLSGRGTPLHPDADLEVYIFSLFNENLKQGPASERNFGLFYPDGRKVYDIEFRPITWCVAKEAAGPQRLQAAMDWTCGQGGADCRAIQSGQACYEPNTLVAHASFAFNSYYQKNRRGAGTCDFQGAAEVVSYRPKFGNCEFSL